MKTPITLLILSLLPSAAPAQDTERLSHGLAHAEADGRSYQPHASADGRFVVFTSQSTNLAPGDTDAIADIFLVDRQGGATVLVSQAAGGGSPNGHSFQPTISANGRWVAYRTMASDHVGGPGAGVYLWDRLADVHVCASRDAGGVPRLGDEPRVSPDGRYVVFTSAWALVPEDTSSRKDVYRYDRVQDLVELVSADPAGVQPGDHCSAPSVSASGRYVVFACKATAWGAAYAAHQHVWLRDMQTGALEAVSVTAAGVPGTNLSREPEISADGRYVAMETAAPNLLEDPYVIQIAVKDRLTGAMDQVSVNDAGQAANNYCYDPCMSWDGRFVAFRTAANNLHLGGSVSYYSVFLRDRLLGQTRKVSLASAALGGAPGTDDSIPGGVSLSGRYVVFSSQASDLVLGDLAGQEDIFLRDTQDGSPASFGWSEPQTIGCIPAIGFTGTPSASAGSGFVVRCTGVRGAQPGMLIYSRTGPAPTPLFGGYLYTAAPIVRTQVQGSGGSSAASCDGSFAFDFNAHAASGVDALLVPGLALVAQYWSRDPGDPDGAHLSDALAFVLGL